MSQGRWISGMTYCKQLCFYRFQQSSIEIKTGMFHNTLKSLTFLKKLNAIDTHQSIAKINKVMETLLSSIVTIVRLVLTKPLILC